MKRLWLILMLLVPMVALAQQITIGGTVIDEKTGVASGLQDKASSP